MQKISLKLIVEAAWEERLSLSPSTTGEVREAVRTILAALDA